MCLGPFNKSFFFFLQLTVVGRNFFIQIYKQKITLDVLSFEQVQEFTKSFFYFVSI